MEITKKVIDSKPFTSFTKNDVRAFIKEYKEMKDLEKWEKDNTITHIKFLSLKDKKK